MAKKNRGKKQRQSNLHPVSGNVVHSVFDDLDWHPLDEEIDGHRDKKFIKRIKPRSEGQADLMQAIKEKNLALAMGPEVERLEPLEHHPGVER